jgi:hypothetical protein
MSRVETICPTPCIGWMSAKWDNFDHLSSIFLGYIKQQKSDMQVVSEA